MNEQIDKQMIRVIRAVNGMGKSELSVAIRVSHSLLKKMESGERAITKATSDKIREAFNLDAAAVEQVREAIDKLTLKK